MKRTISIFTAALLLLGMLIGAGSASAQDDVTLTIWTFGPFFTDLYLGIEADYKEIAPHVSIVVEEIPFGQLYDNLQGAFVAGVGAPDIVDVEQGVISRFLKGEPGLVPLNDLIAPYEDDYIMAKTALYADQGVIYGIDHCLCPVVLYYQHDIFADAGIEMPIDTWDEFVEAAAALTDQGIAALVLDDRSWGDYYMLLLQSGSPGFFDAEGNVIVDSPGNIAVLEWYLGLLESGVAISTGDFYATMGLMTEGKIAAAIGADWYAGTLKNELADRAGHWRAAPLPAFEEGGARTSTHGGTAYSITTQSEHPEEAWAFIEFALFDEDNKIFEYHVNNLLPPILSHLDNEALLAPDPYFDNQPVGELFLELAPEVPFQERGPWFNEASTLVANAVFEATQGEKTAEQALKDAADELRRQIDFG
ncbi:MAG: sugar ABC transporter substrate-binding protein [Chloroflexota bacterium]|nr:sugar ABC transporter substrate-binding protein [Chloroflexota bacterium]